MDPDFNSPVDSKRDLKRTLIKERSINRFETLENLQRSFRPHERLLLYGFAILLSISAFAILAVLNSSVSMTVPTQGGALVEGEVGSARFINSILSISHPDQDVTALVYSGLMRALPHGEIVPDLAQSYTISEDGLIYTFKIREDATFHDGKPLTSADVIYTVQLAQTPDIKSPRRADWEGVQVQAPDQHTVVFTLQRPYAPFIFNTTLGILPKHLWESVGTEEFPFSTLNTHPVGSGPYQVSAVATDNTGSALRYDLVPFKNFPLGPSYLKKITFRFYDNEREMMKAFNAGEISAIAGVSPADLSSLKRDDTQLLSTPLPRVFGVFFNQNHAAVLADISVRKALDAAIDKQALVNSVLGGRGVPLSGPVPPGVLSASYDSTHTTSSSNAATSTMSTKTASTTAAVGTSTPASGTTIVSPADQARAILKKGGWTFDPATGSWSKKKAELAFTLATADEPELVATANAVALAWRAIGVKVDVHIYSLSEINTNVIRPRSYDALLFGEVVGREGDLFAFWHSSQRNDPGLNLAMYANSKADALLQTARTTTDQDDRDKLYKQFDSIVHDDYAAVFLYAPEFLYVVPKNIQGIEIGALTTPAERYLDVYHWYTDTERVWDIFVRNK